MTRMHPADIDLLAEAIVVKLRRPVLVSGGVPLSAVPREDLEARLRSEGLAHRQTRRKVQAKS